MYRHVMVLMVPIALPSQGPSEAGPMQPSSIRMVDLLLEAGQAMACNGSQICEPFANDGRARKTEWDKNVTSLLETSATC